MSNFVGLSNVEWLFIATNVGITLGYAFLALGVVPRITIKLKRTRYGGILFFLTCGTTHLELAYHTIFTSNYQFAELMVEPHMLIIHAVQFFAVWAFVTGLYTEFVKWGPWGQQRRGR